MNKTVNATGRKRCPALSQKDWRRMMLACPIKYTCDIQSGDFLLCGRISRTQWSDARIVGGYTIGTRRFVYIAEHDMLVRLDFYDWVIANHKTVLANIGKR